MTSVLGLDIGGANLKAADPDGQVQTVVFPMWQQHRELPDRLRELSWIDQPDLVGATMTGELADCFDRKADGVAWILDSVQQAFPESEIRIWLTSGEFATPDDAVDLPQLAAASNWHALATWIGRAVPDGPAILMDTGSTTTDIIPLIDGLPVPSGLSDMERLQSGELVYTGIRRTPLCAVMQSVTLNEHQIPLAAELFATTQDVHLLLESIAEDANDVQTADGKPSTVRDAQRRIVRMLCCDQSELNDQDINDIARQFARTQRNQLASALTRVRTNLAQHLRQAKRQDVEIAPRMILSGSGAFLAAEVAAECGLSASINLAESVSSSISEAACAFALARLVSERCRDELLETLPFQHVEM